MIRGNIKRFLAGILTAAVLFTCAPASIYADELVGNDELFEDAADNGISIETEDILDVSSDTEELYEEVSADEDAHSDVCQNTDNDLYGDQMSGGEMPEVHPIEVENPSASALDQVMSGNDRLGGEDLPASYISPDLPELRSQSPYGACWTFSSMALAEMSLIRKGIVSSDSIDLSELHLAYFSYNTVTDPLGGTKGDKNEMLASGSVAAGDFMRRGGNRNYSKNILASWTGAADEAKAPYSSAGDALINGLDHALAYDDKSHMTDYYDVQLNDTEYDDVTNDPVSRTFREDGIKAAKRLIYEYGAVGISYYSDKSGCYDKTNNSYYDSTLRNTNHAVTIVGWDDEFRKDKFKGTDKPAKDGAWLIRNTHKSTNGGDYEHNQNYEGYFWLSYYSMSNGDVANAFVFENADDYDNSYQYDGVMSSGEEKRVGSGDNITVANVFDVKDSGNDSLLKAVSFATPTAEVTYEINIYRDIKNGGSPSKGTLVQEARTTGTTVYAGYHTVKLTAPVRLKSGERFAVAVKLIKTESDRPSIATEESVEGSWLKTTAPISKGQSYYFNGNNWIDYETSGLRKRRANFRIKAFTDDLEDPTIPPKTYPAFEFKDGALEGNFHTYTYTGSAIKPRLAVRHDGRLLVEGTDYTLSYKNNINANTPVSSATVYSSDPQIIVKFRGSYSGKEVLNFKIKPADYEELDIKGAVVARPVSAMVKRKDGFYVRQELKPVIYYGDRKLKEKKDYTLEYCDTREGAYEEACDPDTPWKIRVKAMGSNYSGSFETYELLRDPLDGRSYVELNSKGVRFTTGSSRIEFADKLPEYTGTYTDPSTGETKELIKDIDYTVDIVKGGRPGTAIALITAKEGLSGNCVGQLTKKFKITKADISGRVSISMNRAAYDYEMGGVKPQVSVNYVYKDVNIPLVEGRDYKVTYGNNKAVSGQGGKTPYVKIKGIGNFKGKVLQNFTIEKQSLEYLESDNLFISDIDRDDLSDINKKPPIIIRDSGGRKLKNGTDYVIADHRVTDDKLTLTINGKNNYCGTVTVECKIRTGAELKGAKLRCYESAADRESGKTVKSFEYTGHEICPGIIDVTMGKGAGASCLEQGVDYEIIGYCDNTDKGTGYVIIRGLNDYTGIKALKFKISSRRISLRDDR